MGHETGGDRGDRASHSMNVVSLSSSSFPFFRGGKGFFHSLSFSVCLAFFLSFWGWRGRADMGAPLHSSFVTPSFYLLSRIFALCCMHCTALHCIGFFFSLIPWMMARVLFLGCLLAWLLLLLLHTCKIASLDLVAFLSSRGNPPPLKKNPGLVFILQILFLSIR